MTRFNIMLYEPMYQNMIRLASFRIMLYSSNLHKIHTLEMSKTPLWENSHTRNLIFGTKYFWQNPSQIVFESRVLHIDLSLKYVHSERFWSTVLSKFSHRIWKCVLKRVGR